MLEPRRLLSTVNSTFDNVPSDVPDDMKTDAYLFIGDHSASNSERWRMHVGGVPHDDGGRGEIARIDRTFETGKSYKIEVEHMSTDRKVDGEDAPDYDYRAWIDDYARPAWTDGQTIAKGKTWFTTDNNAYPLIQKRHFDDNNNHQNAAHGKTAWLHVPQVDLDVDSDNKDGFTKPTNTLAEDNLERDSSTGKHVWATSGDIDGDGIVDYADLDGIVGAKFVPMTVQLSRNLAYANPAQIKITFDYAGSDPEVFRNYEADAELPALPDDGLLRVWKKDAAGPRDAESDYVEPGYSYFADDLNLSPGGPGVTLFVEAVAGTTSPKSIDVRVDVVGYRWNGQLQDTVHVQPLELDLVAHRAGLNAGETLAKQIEDAGAPERYTLLVNNDFEEDDPDGGLDFENDHAAVNQDGYLKDEAGNPVDDDLARFTIRQLPEGLTSGVIRINLSNPQAVRLFKSDGTLLYEEGVTSTEALTLYLSSPGGYLQDVTNRDVDIWVEAMEVDPKFVFSIDYKSNYGDLIAQDQVAATLAEWNFVDSTGGQDRDGLPSLEGGSSCFHSTSGYATRFRTAGVLQDQSRWDFG